MNEQYELRKIRYRATMEYFRWLGKKNYSGRVSNEVVKMNIDRSEWPNDARAAAEAGFRYEKANTNSKRK